VSDDPGKPEDEWDPDEPVLADFWEQHWAEQDKAQAEGRPPPEGRS
jgi:hypothetical protein